MRNVLIICRKELRSYFVSPIAYILLIMFGVIFGFFFWNALGFFVNAGMEMQMRGEAYPMNLNEQIIRPLLSNVAVVGLFFIPMITMRLFAEEKRSGTIELLATSPVRDPVSPGGARARGSLLLRGTRGEPEVRPETRLRRPQPERLAWAMNCSEARLW